MFACVYAPVAFTGSIRRPYFTPAQVCNTFSIHEPTSQTLCYALFHTNCSFTNMLILHTRSVVCLYWTTGIMGSDSSGSLINTSYAMQKPYNAADFTGN
jgi:hypothetical protein